MDILSEIRKNTENLTREESEGLRAVLEHLRRAEEFFASARERRDPGLYRDVVSRTNSAYEGMLKEAYKWLLAEDPAGKKMHELEEILRTGDVLTGRTQSLMVFYRREIRNPSTHDHTLSFEDQDALLAVASASAFTAVLADQIIEALSSRRERARTLASRERIATEASVVTMPSADASVASTGVSGARGFAEDIARRLFVLGRELAGDFRTAYREPELAGRFSGFLSALDSRISVSHQSLLPGALKPDLLIERGNHIVVLEFRAVRQTLSHQNPAVAKLIEYSLAAGAEFAILFVPPAAAGQRMVMEHIQTRSRVKAVAIQPAK